MEGFLAAVDPLLNSWNCDLSFIRTLITEFREAQCMKGLFTTGVICSRIFQVVARSSGLTIEVCVYGAVPLCLVKWNSGGP